MDDFRKKLKKVKTYLTTIKVKKFLSLAVLVLWHCLLNIKQLLGSLYGWLFLLYQQVRSTLASLDLRVILVVYGLRVLLEVFTYCKRHTLNSIKIELRKRI